LSLPAGPVLLIPGLIRIPNEVPRAVLPRGHALWYQDEHNILQVGYELGQSGNVVGWDTIWWTSAALLKDNGVQPFTAAELVAPLLGPSVSTWEPREALHRVFAIGRRPYWELSDVTFGLIGRNGYDCWTCGYVTSPKTLSDDYSVEVPFTYAVPMLTGWDLGDPFSDHHVLEVGAYIDHFRFVPNSNGRSGRLYYTVVSTYSDDGSSVGNSAHHKVTVLGFSPVDTSPAGQLNPIDPVIKQ
jgi:hypothetical protein